MPRSFALVGLCAAVATLSVCATPDVVSASAAPQQASQTAPPGASAAPLPAPNTTFRRFSLRESLRKETLTKHSSEGFSRVTESQSVAKGKTTLEFELPRESVGEVNPATELSVQVGSGVRWVGKLGDDPKFAASRPETKIDIFWEGQNTGSRIRRGSVTVKWEKDVVRVKFEREAGNSSTAAAETAINSVSGSGDKVDGEVAVWLRLGGAVARANVPFQATVKRRTAGNDTVYGEAVTADVKGEFKP